MNSLNQNPLVENNVPGGSKIARLQMRARRLQQQAQQARERLREEESAQEKLARLMARRRIESEQRLLGGLAYIAGLGSVRMRAEGAEASADMPLDADLLIGAMRRVYEDLKAIADDTDLQQLRSNGASLRRVYYEHRDNPRFHIPLGGVANGKEKETGHDH